MSSNEFFWELREIQGVDKENDTLEAEITEKITDEIKKKIKSFAQRYSCARNCQIYPAKIFDEIGQDVAGVTENRFYELFAVAVHKMNSDPRFGLSIYLFNDISTTAITTLDLGRSIMNHSVTRIEFSWETAKESQHRSFGGV